MTFSEALEEVKKGKRITRQGWNGKGQYVELGVNIYYYNLKNECIRANHQDVKSQALVFVGTRGSQVGWLASQSDMLADDWEIFEDS